MSAKPESLKRDILAKVAEYHKLTRGLKGDRFVAGQRVDYAGRIYDEREMVNLVDSALEFWLTHGRHADEFERNLAGFLGVDHCLMVNSGSSANLLAFMALTSPLLGERRVRRGDEVITVAAAFPTTVAPVVQYGAVPVFVDVELETANLDCSKLEEACSDKTKAVMLAHALGNPFDIEKVKKICEARGLWLIEDNCDALGSKYKGRRTGSFGDIGTSSFYPPHHITTGEGGAVYTNNATLNKIMLSMRDWGRDCWCRSGVDNTCGCRFSGRFGTLPKGYDHKYVYSHFGYNLKATDMQAAIGLAQLEKLPEFIRARRENFDYLYERLKDVEQFILFTHLPDSEPSWFGFLITLDETAGFTRNEMTTFLEKSNIQTRNLFAGNITRHPCFDALTEGVDYRVVGELTNTDQIMNNSFWIGVYPGMTKDKLDYMADKLVEFAMNQ